MRPLAALSALVLATEQGGGDSKERGTNGRAVVFAIASRLAIYDAADDAWLHTRPRADAAMRDRRNPRDAAVRGANAVARATTSDGRDAPAGAATHSAKKQKFLFLAKQILSGPREHVGAPPRPPVRVPHGTDRQASL